MKRLYIQLHHGRVHPDEDLQDWGFDGPLVGPLLYIHRAYLGEPNIGFEQSELAARNALAFGFSVDETSDMALEYEGDLIKFEGFYFGDQTISLWSDQEAKVYNEKWFSVEKLRQLGRQARYLKNRVPILSGDHQC